MRDQTKELISWIQHYAQNRINSFLIDKRRTIPPHIFLDFGNKGLFGLYVPKQYSGLELPTYDILCILEQLAAIDMSLAVVVNDAILSSYTLVHSPNHKLKEFYLPQVATGRIIMGNAITEASAGSDPYKIEATATPDGKGGWLVNGSKLWVGSATWSTIIAVFVQQLDNEGNAIGITGFLVPTDAPGVILGNESLTLGMKGFVKNTVIFRNVSVSISNLLGSPYNGMTEAKNTMHYIRMCLGMICVGSAKRCIQLMHRYSSRRQIATGLLLDNPVTQVRISQLITEVKIIDVFIKHIATLIDANHIIPEEVFIVCKNIASNCLAVAADTLIQILGARGYEENNIAAKIFRDARPFRIFEGPNEALDMYLGSRILNHNEELPAFIDKNLQQSELSNQLKTLTKTFEQQFLQDKFKIFQNYQKQQYWAYFCMAEVATNFLLLATLKQNITKQQPDHLLQNALDYLIHRTQTSVDQMLQKSNFVEQFLLQVPEIHRIVNAYQEEIGDIEQNLPGENVELDSMLKINPNVSLEKELRASKWLEVLYSWNDTNIEVSDELNVTELITKNANSKPDKIAISDGKTYITYKQLDLLSTKLAALLQQFNLQQEDIIGIYLPRSIDTIISFIAVLKVGCAYLPLDISYPKDRLKYILEDSGATLLITKEALTKSLTHLSCKVFCIDILKEYSTSSQPNFCFVNTLPTHLAYVIYTSGSTGRPKGVMIEHRSLTNLVYHTIKNYNISEQDRVLQFASLSFDAAIEEIYSTLIAGAELVLRTDAMIDSLDFFLHEVKRLDITILDLPTGYWHQLMLSIYDPTIWKECVNLRLVILGGEKVNFSEMKTWFSAIGKSIRLINTYGPTEATVITTNIDLCHKYLENNDRIVPIGKPISNAKVYVLNNSLRPVEIGAIGELYIGGVGVARGYLNNKDLTAQRFIDNPFQTEEEKVDVSYGLRGRNARIYKTGDLVRWLSDGNLEYIGRTDFQVKVRGFRIELGEIESVLSSHEEIEQCVVLTKQHITLNESKSGKYFNTNDENSNSTDYLIAYYTTVSRNSLDEITLLSYLSSKLPEYMTPSAFVWLDSLPLSINGKLDYSTLPDPQLSRSSLSYVPPRNELEAKLCCIFADVLGINEKTISVTDDFLRLGGNSILALNLVSRVNKEMVLPLTVTTIFTHKNVRRIASFLEKSTISNIVIPKCELEKNQQYLLSFAQERLWFIEKYEGGTNAYNIPIVYELNSDVSIVAINKAIREVVQRHEILRSLIQEDCNGNVYQQVMTLEDRPLNIDYIELLSEEDIDIYLIQNINQIFDLSNEYPIRATIYNTQNSYILSLIIHHIAFDGWSLGIFINEISESYKYHNSALSNQDKINLPELFIQYKDFAVWQKSYLSKTILDQQLSYWKEKLEGYETLNLFTDYTRPNKLDYQGKRIYFELEYDLSCLLKKLSKKLGITIYSLMLSAYYLMLQAHSNQDDIVIGTPVANRHYPQTEHLIGFFVNMLALRVKIPSAIDTSLEGFIRNIAREVIEVQRHQDIPFQKLVGALNITHDSSRNPIFQVVFGVQGFGNNIIGNALLKSNIVSPCRNLNDIFYIAKFDLETFIDDSEVDGVLRGFFNYRVRLYKESRIKSFINTYVNILKQFGRLAS